VGPACRIPTPSGLPCAAIADINAWIAEVDKA
jgi:hypothetical protein